LREARPATARPARSTSRSGRPRVRTCPAFMAVWIAAGGAGAVRAVGARREGLKAVQTAPWAPSSSGCRGKLHVTVFVGCHGEAARVRRTASRS
jgi:hypothetical protein